jgi:hypothetical protein
MTADLALAAGGLGLAAAAAIAGWLAARAIGRAAADARHADACLEAVARLLDLGDLGPRSKARDARVTDFRSWRDAIVERVQECERRAAPAAGAVPVLSRDEGEATVATLRRVAGTLTALSDALARGKLAPRAHDIAARLALEEELFATRRTIDALIAAGTPDAVIDAFEAGALSHVLTTAELFAAYFPADADLALFAESYAAAAALLRLELAYAGIAVVVPRFLGPDPGRDAEHESLDRRELRRIPEIAAAAGRAGERAGYDEAVVVDCTVPGRIGLGGRRPATVVVWERASWRAP